MLYLTSTKRSAFRIEQGSLQSCERFLSSLAVVILGLLVIGGISLDKGIGFRLIPTRMRSLRYAYNCVRMLCIALCSWRQRSLKLCLTWNRQTIEEKQLHRIEHRTGREGCSRCEVELQQLSSLGLAADCIVHKHREIFEKQELLTPNSETGSALAC